MATTLDTRMNDFTPATDADYFYAEDKDGNQVKMKKTYLKDMIGISEKNIRKSVIISPGEIINLGVKGGLIVFNTTSLQEQCVALFSCYGEGGTTVSLLSANTAFITGNRETNIGSRLILFREDSTSSCYIKNNFGTSLSIAYQVVGGFW